MNERRKNWKADVSNAAQARQAKREQFLVDLDTTRREITTCGLDFERHDKLFLTMREIIAKLATLMETE